MKAVDFGAGGSGVLRLPHRGGPPTTRRKFLLRIQMSSPTVVPLRMARMTDLKLAQQSDAAAVSVVHQYPRHPCSDCRPAVTAGSGTTRVVRSKDLRVPAAVGTAIEQGEIAAGVGVREAAPCHRGPRDDPAHAARHGGTGPAHDIVMISQPGMLARAAPLAVAAAAAERDLQSDSALAAMKIGTGPISRRQRLGPAGGREVAAIHEVTTEHEHQLADGAHAVAGLSVAAAQGMLMGGLGVGVPKHGRGVGRCKRNGSRPC